MPLRYGENPHQQAALYLPDRPRTPAASPRPNRSRARSSATTISTTPMPRSSSSRSSATGDPTVVIVKHANPCGVATRGSLIDAWREALACDSVSAFGGIVATNRPLDAETAEAITQIFTEVVVAPDADEEAKAIFARKKNLRLLLTGELPDPARAGQSIAVIAGGILVQDRDNGMVARDQLKCVTKRQPTEQEIRDCLFAWTVAKHVKSNAIVYAKDGVTAGIGAGQMNRRDSARIAAIRAREAAEANGWPEPRTVGSAVASDAFFPFADGLLSAAEAGATAVIQPGGSIRDEEVIAAADEAGLAMLFTGMRHFRHDQMMSSLRSDRGPGRHLRPRAARARRDLRIRNSSRSSGPKPLVHSTAPNATRIAGTPRISCQVCGRKKRTIAPTATPAAVAQARSQRQPDTRSPSCLRSRQRLGDRGERQRDAQPDRRSRRLDRPAAVPRPA